MTKTTGVFNIETCSGGVSIVSTRVTITNAAMSVQELDAQIVLAKEDLNAAAKRAKAAIIELQSLSRLI